MNMGISREYFYKKISKADKKQIKYFHFSYESI